MKHRHKNRILGRRANHRQALLRNLASALLQHGYIVTTDAKGKELRRYFESLVTMASGENTLHRRRNLGREVNNNNDLEELIKLSAGKQGGGYLRLTRLVARSGDAAKMTKVEIVNNNK
jgi:large subunit ribosomal protein L17